MDNLSEIGELKREINTLKSALARMNASDVDQFNEYEQQIADLQRHKELLRAALLGAWSWNDGMCPCCSFYPEDGHLPDCKYKAAIDGGAMGEG